MTITLDLQPEIEKGLLAQAAARGLSLADYLQEIVARQAQAFPEPWHAPRTGQALIEACDKVRGLPRMKKSIRFSAALVHPQPDRG